MKKVTSVFTLLLFLISFNTNGQATSAGVGNTPLSPLDFIGWRNTVTIPLEVRQDNVTFPYYPIEFWTRQLKRMEVNGATGNVGISNIWPGFNPVDQLHQNIYGNNSVYHRFTNGNTGMGTGDGLRVGITYDGVGTLAEFN